MGKKVHPTGFRVGTYLPWKSKWYSDNADYKLNLLEDLEIRKVLNEKIKLAGVTEVEIERLPKSMNVNVTVSRPGVVIGRGGSGLEDLKKFILEIIKKRRDGKVKDIKIDFKVNEVKNHELSAKLTAERIVADLERRMPHRRVVAKVMERVMAAGALGVKIVLAGRIAGADISRVEKYHQGSVPTQTLREDIDYYETPALTKRGYVGVKVYIHRKGEE